MQNTVELLSQIVRNAGRIMLGVSGVDSDNDICKKSGDANYVTVFDVRVQNYILKEIKAIFSDAVFLAEEKENDGYGQAWNDLRDRIYGNRSCRVPALPRNASRLL